MTAAVIDFVTRRPVRALQPEPAVIPTPAWWHCPAWCAADEDNCYGGEVFDLGGDPVHTSRLHHGVIWSRTVYGVDGAPVDVRVQVRAVEDPDEGIYEAPAVSISVEGLATDPDTAEQIATAILAAAAAARQPLPALSPRSPSAPVGGGWASIARPGLPPVGPGRALPLEGGDPR